MHSRLPFVFAAVACTGCSGLALGLNTPGAPAHIGHGALAVDDRTDTTYVLATHVVGNATERRLHAVPPKGAPRVVGISTSGRDRRLLFPSSGVLLMSETKTGERLTLFDRATLDEKVSVTVTARYHGTRASPSGRWIAVADNDDDALPIHVIDSKSLAVRPIPHRGDWLEAAWLTEKDVLVAAIFDDGVRIATWSMREVSSRQFATDETGAWAAPELDITVEGKREDRCDSFTWVTASEDGHWVVVPVRDETSGAYELVLVDTEKKTQRIVPDAKGPAGFTGDGTTLVTYASTGAPQPGKECGSHERDQIVLVDVATLERRPVEVPGMSRFNFHVLDDTVTVAPVPKPNEKEPHAPLFVFDVPAAASGTVIDTAHAHLDEFIQRPIDRDLWLVSHGLLHRVGMNKHTFESFDLGFEARHVNYLPERDWLVMDRHRKGHPTAPAELVFWDPDAREVARRVPLGDQRH